jgi:hypothetical protein
MKRILPLVILLLVITQSHAQEKNITIALNDDEFFVDRIHLGEAGFMLKSTHRLFLYSATCDLIWEKNIKENYSSGENVTVASPDGGVVYHVSAKTDNFFKKPQYITQIKKDGQKTEFQLPASKEFGKTVVSMFGDSDYLYYLMLEESKEMKNKEVIVMHRFSATDMKHSKISLALPTKPDSYWYFLGQKDNIKYIANKDVEMQRAENKLTVVGFKNDGSIASTVTIPISLDKKFTRPALNINGPAKAWVEIKDNDFSARTSTMSVPGGAAVTYNQQNLAYGTGPKTVTSRGPSTEYTSSRLKENQAAYTHISMDEETGSFYVYSLLGTKPFNKSGIANVYDGFYIFKYNAAGNNVWKLQYNGGAELEEEKFFHIHGMPADRHINLLILPQENLNFTIRFKKSLAVYVVSSEGKIVRTEKQEGLNRLAGSYASNSSITPPRAAKNKSNDNEITSNFLTSKGEVALRIGLGGKDSISMVYLEGSGL